MVVEAVATERQARGPFLLELWDEEGTSVVALGNVRFPQPP
ncbi:MAG TPA: hypothetical protein VLQ93_23605 [Myxococcaceae bacterium]|nr:hypothetical protein [Myxococcaceae bacterium]